MLNIIAKFYLLLILYINAEFYLLLLLSSRIRDFNEIRFPCASCLIPSSILVASNLIQNSSTTPMLTIILLTLFVNLEAARRPAQTGQPATTTLFMTVLYEKGREEEYIKLAKNELRRQLKRHIIPYIESMVSVNARNESGRVALDMKVSKVPDCNLVLKMAKDAEDSGVLINSATVQCGGGAARKV
ncbi:unnamed protein product [Cylicocyclus nassatus]|uniref:Uncharacterized protein n=1 Tax=Cylicocyclus nassatus TaxID=53992 RepID=A0AA36GTE9_CYLNA|nr:unnamed protein product [Cylicocyclus nassatus]